MTPFADPMMDGDTIQFYLAGIAPALEDTFRFSGEQAQKIIAELSAR